MASLGYTVSVVGHDLHNLYCYENGKDGNGEERNTCYLLMTALPPLNLDLRYNKPNPDDYGLLLDCLRPHTKNDYTIAISGDPTVILNIHGLRVKD